MVWTLGFMVCDMWIAADVIASTASILNLVAIAVDRYMAVRMPIKYAQQLRTRRIAITIFLVWTISFVIGIPIMAGFNTPPDGQERPENDCAFYNADYILMSGFISFWVPTVLLFIIYWYVFSTLKRRSSAMRAKMHQNNTTTTSKPSAVATSAANIASQLPKSLPKIAAATAKLSGKQSTTTLNNNVIAAATANPSAPVIIKATLPSSTTTTKATSSSSSSSAATNTVHERKPPDNCDRLNIIQHAHVDLLAPCSPTLATTNTTTSSSSGTTTTTTANNTLISNKSSTTTSDDLTVQQHIDQTNQNVRPSSTQLENAINFSSQSASTAVLLSNLQFSMHQQKNIANMNRKPNIHLHSNVVPTSPVWVQRLNEYDQQAARLAFLDTTFHVEHVEGPTMIAASSFGYEISTLPRRNRPRSTMDHSHSPKIGTTLTKSHSAYAVELNAYHHRPHANHHHGVENLSKNDEIDKVTLTAVHVDEFAATQQVILSSAHVPRRSKPPSDAVASAAVIQTLLPSTNHVNDTTSRLSVAAEPGKPQRALSWQFPPTNTADSTHPIIQSSATPNNIARPRNSDNYDVQVIDTNTYQPSTFGGGRASRVLRWFRNCITTIIDRAKLSSSNPSSSTTDDDDHAATIRSRRSSHAGADRRQSTTFLSNMRRFIYTRRGTLGAGSRDQESSSDQQMSRVGINGLMIVADDEYDEDAGSSTTEKTRRISEPGGGASLIRKSESQQSTMLPLSGVSAVGVLVEHSSSSTSWFGLGIGGGGQKSVSSNHLNKIPTAQQLQQHRPSTISLDNPTTSVAAVVVGTAAVGTAVGGARPAVTASSHSHLQQQQLQQRQHMAAVKSGRRKATARRERKATATMAVVLAIYLICWIPFFALHTLNAICMKLEPDGSRRENMWCSPSYTAFIATTWIGYGNSFINPVIYSVFNPDFRRAFRQILSCR